MLPDPFFLSEGWRRKSFIRKSVLECTFPPQCPIRKKGVCVCLCVCVVVCACVCVCVCEEAIVKRAGGGGGGGCLHIIEKQCIHEHIKDPWY